MKKFTKDEIAKDVKGTSVDQKSGEAASNVRLNQESTETVANTEPSQEGTETTVNAELSQEKTETAVNAELSQESTEMAVNAEPSQKGTETVTNAELNQKGTETAANTESKQEGTETTDNAKPNQEDLEADNREKQELNKGVDGSSDGIQKADDGQNEISEEGKVVKKRRKKGRIVAVLLVMIFVIALAFAYGRGVYYYKRSFFPQLEVNGVSCGNMSLQEAADKIQQWYADNYSLKLLDREGEEIMEVLPSDVQMVFPVEEELSKILEGQNAYKWFIYVFSEEGETREIVISPQYDMAKLQRLLEQRGLFDVSRGEAPQDAYISEYQEELKQFVIVPEREGTVLEQEITIACAAEALIGMQDSLDLYEAGCFKTAEITADNEQLKKRLEALNRVVGTCITYDWNGTQEILDGELIHQWMVLDGEEITLDEEQVAAYVAQMAKEYDTYGKKRKFVTTSGLTLTLPSGAYGWKTNRSAETEALIELILAGAVTEREPIYTSEGWVKGEDDIGDSYVEINLTDQHLYLYIDGEMVLETDFVSGNAANGNSTPAGVFGLTYKTRNAVLRGPDYETPVSYWMPFNGNIGMHDATWRRSFGGDIYLTNGSHGCINLPLKMAKTIYEYMSTGFPVICYYY
ncbi:MAG: L,D-transpeptidase/peptidoglycan binding protein [Lachnospiraceae bacterium]|nr:L,D-transpeptidase/peptidoglycan binding protein [Lachnospiraceae bacterium]